PWGLLGRAGAPEPHRESRLDVPALRTRPRHERSLLDGLHNRGCTRLEAGPLDETPLSRHSSQEWSVWDVQLRLSGRITVLEPTLDPTLAPVSGPSVTPGAGRSRAAPKLRRSPRCARLRPAARRTRPPRSPAAAHADLPACRIRARPGPTR